MNIKKLSLSLMIIAISMSLLSSCITFKMDSTGVYNKNNLELINTTSIDLSDIKEINIDVMNVDVEFGINSKNEIQIDEYSTSEEESFLLFSMDDGIVEIKKDKTIEENFLEKDDNDKSLRINNNYYKTIKIYMPSDYANIIRVITTNGDIQSDIDMDFSLFSFTTSSGDVIVNNIDNTNNGTLYIKTTSGDIAASYINVSEMNFTSTSGDMIISNVSTGGAFHSTSGDMKLDLNEITNNLTVETTSGDVSLSATNIKKANISCVTKSGDVHGLNENSSSKSKAEDEVDITITTTSGDIFLR